MSTFANLLFVRPRQSTKIPELTIGNILTPAPCTMPISRCNRKRATPGTLFIANHAKHQRQGSGELSVHFIPVLLHDEAITGGGRSERVSHLGKTTTATRRRQQDDGNKTTASLRDRMVSIHRNNRPEPDIATEEL